MAIIKFNHNWNNKLASITAFTTIRLSNRDKYRVGETYEIFLTQGKEEKFLCYADIAEIKHFKLDQLNTWMAYIDTGYSLEECRKIIQTMYKNKVKDWSKQYLSFILLVKLKPKKASASDSTVKNEALQVAE